MNIIRNAYFDNLPTKDKISNLYSLLLELNVGDNIKVTKEYIEMLTELKIYIDELINEKNIYWSKDE